MPWFEYEGLTPGGTAIAGHIEAASCDGAGEELARLQIEVRELKQASAPRRAASLGEDDLVFFNDQLASLAEAGIALDEGLAQLARDIDSPRLRQWIQGLVEDLRRGVPIDRAIESREQGLPILYSRVLRAGIDSGELPATLLNLNQHLRLAGSTRRLLWETASYPLLVITLGLLVVSFFFMSVASQFRGIFKDFGCDLPWMTKFLFSVAEVYPIILVSFLGSIAGLVLVWHLLRYSMGGRSLRESIVLSIPIVGRVHRASLLSRFLRSLSTAVAAGIPLPQGLRLGADATGSALLIRDADHLANEVERGQSILAASQSTRIIPPLFGFCVQVAAGREALPAALGQLAHSYENRALHTQFMVRAILFPLLVVSVGGFLFFGVVGMFLPLVHLINAVSG